jgi:hypothetical protein
LTTDLCDGLRDGGVERAGVAAARHPALRHAQRAVAEISMVVYLLVIGVRVEPAAKIASVAR